MTTLTIVSTRLPADRAAVARAPRVVRPVSAPAPGRRTAWPRPVPCERSYEGGLHGSRLTRRGRLVVTAVWVLLAAVAALGMLRPGLAADPAPDGTTTVVVQPGDTLWQLARGLDTTADPRTTIDAIVELNDLRSGADIAAGDVLVVPLAG
jgi:nucleoid-associated protein YgaU